MLVFIKATLLKRSRLKQSLLWTSISEPHSSFIIQALAVRIVSKVNCHASVSSTVSRGRGAMQKKRSLLHSRLETGQLFNVVWNSMSHKSVRASAKMILAPVCLWYLDLAGVERGLAIPIIQTIDFDGALRDHYLCVCCINQCWTGLLCRYRNSMKNSWAVRSLSGL